MELQVRPQQWFLHYAVDFCRRAVSVRLSARPAVRLTVREFC